MTTAQLKAETYRIFSQRNKLPHDQQMAFVTGEIAKLENSDDREICETVLFGGIDIADTEMKMAAKEERREVRIFYSGLGLLILGVILAFILPSNPTKIQLFVVQVTIALGAAAFGANIPGFLAIKGKIKDQAGFHNMTYQATGGLAIFFIVYFFVPSLLR